MQFVLNLDIQNQQTITYSMSEQIIGEEVWGWIGSDGKVTLPEDAANDGLTVFRVDSPSLLEEDPALKALERNYPPKTD